MGLSPFGSYAQGVGSASPNLTLAAGLPITQHAETIADHLKSSGVVIVCGETGSGKSTLIRTFNGIETLDGGSLDVLGVRLDSAHAEPQVRAIRRRVGMVFQQFNLFPHLSIIDNITLAPIKVQQRAKAAAEQRAMELLDQMGIREQAHKYPAQLSGGQQQQLAIARALLGKPKLLLLDEPTEGIQPNIVQDIEAAVRRIIADTGIGVLLVEQHLHFVRQADRYYAMQRGGIVASGPTRELSQSVVDQFLSV